MRSALITNTAALSMMVLTYSTSAALHTIDPWYATLINMPVGAQVFYAPSLWLLGCAWLTSRHHFKLHYFSNS